MIKVCAIKLYPLFYVIKSMKDLNLDLVYSYLILFDKIQLELKRRFVTKKNEHKMVPFIVKELDDIISRYTTHTDFPCCESTLSREDESSQNSLDTIFRQEIKNKFRNYNYKSKLVNYKNITGEVDGETVILKPSQKESLSTNGEYIITHFAELINYLRDKVSDELLCLYVSHCELRRNWSGSNWSPHSTYPDEKPKDAFVMECFASLENNQNRIREMGYSDTVSILSGELFADVDPDVFGYKILPPFPYNLEWFTENKDLFSKGKGFPKSSKLILLTNPPYTESVIYSMMETLDRFYDENPKLDITCYVSMPYWLDMYEKFNHIMKKTKYWDSYFPT